MLETEDISRFKNVGNFSSYCCCVDSIRLSNGKRKELKTRKMAIGFCLGILLKLLNLQYALMIRLKSFTKEKLEKLSK